MDKRIETILINYFSKSVSFDDLVILNEWLKQSSNGLIFKKYVKANYLMEVNMQDFDTEREKEKLLKRIAKRRGVGPVRNIGNMFEYAVVFLILFSVGFLVLKDYFPAKEQEMLTRPNENTLLKRLPGNANVVLTLSDGSEMVLDKDKEIALKNGAATAKGIVYDASVDLGNNAVAYNYLTIPRGGQYFVKLSDGTKVWMNSETKLKYPLSFRKGMPREIELLYGEAFFDVSKSEKDRKGSFKVHINGQVVEVLGTEFNIKANLDEKQVTTTLVEGKVAVKKEGHQVLLNPAEQSIVKESGNEIQVRKVPKVFEEIAWKEGYFVFKQKTMKDIMKVLSRWYDMDYTFKNAEKQNKSFTGVLDRETTIDQILKYIQKTNEIKYEIDGNTVIIE